VTDGQSLTDDDQLLASLSRRPEWAALKRRAEQLRKDRTERVARDLLHRTRQLNPAQLEYERGVFDGINLLLNEPAIEHARFERLLERGDQA
jgi:hypothetical protein